MVVVVFFYVSDWSHFMAKLFFFRRMWPTYTFFKKEKKNDEQKLVQDKRMFSKQKMDFFFWKFFYQTIMISLTIHFWLHWIELSTHRISFAIEIEICDSELSYNLGVNIWGFRPVPEPESLKKLARNWSGRTVLKKGCFQMILRRENFRTKLDRSRL